MVHQNEASDPYPKEIQRMLEAYVICTLVLVINSGVLWFVINQKLEELQTDVATVYKEMRSRFDDVDGDLMRMEDNADDNDQLASLH